MYTLEIFDESDHPQGSLTLPRPLRNAVQIANWIKSLDGCHTWHIKFGECIIWDSLTGFRSQGLT